MAHIPSEGDFLQSHHHHAGSRTDDEHRTSHAGTVGEQLPEDAVNGEVGAWKNVIHAHAASHEGHVVDNAGNDTDDARHDVVIAVRGFVERLSEGSQNARFLQGGHSHQDAEEEEDGAHVDAFEQLRHAHLHALVDMALRAVEKFRDAPEQTQHEQDAHERRQTREETEDGHEDEAAHTDEEHHVAFQT